MRIITSGDFFFFGKKSGRYLSRLMTIKTICFATEEKCCNCTALQCLVHSEEFGCLITSLWSNNVLSLLCQCFVGRITFYNIVIESGSKAGVSIKCKWLNTVYWFLGSICTVKGSRFRNISMMPQISGWVWRFTTTTRGSFMIILLYNRNFRLCNRQTRGFVPLCIMNYDLNLKVCQQLLARLESISKRENKISKIHHAWYTLHRILVIHVYTCIYTVRTR